jgi:hypothetical protein
VTDEDRDLLRRAVEALERVAIAEERSLQALVRIRRVLEREEVRSGSARVCAQHRPPRLRAVP